MFTGMKSCLGCERRHVGCHGHCEDYAEDRRKRDEMMARIHEQQNAERSLDTIEIRRIER